MKTYKLISTVDNSQHCNNKKVDNSIDIDSRATSVMTPVEAITPMLISSETTIDEALMILERRVDGNWLYVGSPAGLTGIVSHVTLVSRNVLMIANQKGVNRSDLVIGDVMHKVSKLPAVSHESIKHALVGDVKKTMENDNIKIMLVLEESGHMAGVITYLTMNAVLEEPLEISNTVHSFKDAFDVIHEHKELI